MTFKAVFLDIDGTILMPNHRYEQSTVEAIKQLQEQGILTFIATGRPTHEIMTLADELQIDNIIGYNGARAIVDGKVIVEQSFQPETVKRLIEQTKELGHEMVLYTKEKNHFTAIDDVETKRFIDTFQMENNVELPETNATENFLGISLMKLADADVSKYEWDEQIHLSRCNVPGLYHAYDLIRSNVNKGAAIKKVMEHLGLQKEETIAFGDGMNDKEMFQHVGVSFAMGNADPRLFPYATYETTAVTDSGIFNGLNKLGLVQ